MMPPDNGLVRTLSTSKEDLYRLNGRLFMLDQAQEAIQEQLEELLAGDEASSASEQAPSPSE